jgi:iron complex outermembrane receptor protein
MRNILILLLLLICNGLVAQRIALKGVVLDKNSGKPVSGASVTIESSGAGTSTDAAGEFNLSVAATDVLNVSSLGYTSVSVKVNGQSFLQIMMVPSASSLQELVVTGSRKGARVRTETAVPVDQVNVRAASMPTGRTDLTAILNTLAPSLNYNKQSGSDGADHIDLATLRGLGPDQTLVLVNGKRRHQTAFVAVFGTRGRGNSGTDMSAIPMGAIDKVEILRDGASAQYGSDAIAGVININLKKATKVLSGNIGYGGYYDSKFNTSFKPGLGQYETGTKFDGQSFNASLNYGVPVGKQGGFVNFTFEGLSTGKTFRQVLDTTDPVNNPDGMFINIYRRAHGDASLRSLGTMINAEFPIAGKKSTVYSFAGFTNKASDAFAFTRNFSARPERFPTDANGNLIPVPDIIKTSADGEQYYNPHIQTRINDFNWTLGIRGKWKDGTEWDLSNTIGQNDFHFFGDRTFNASIGPKPNNFDAGGFNFLQNTTNLNFSKGISKNLNLAYGAEFRVERYKLYAGEEASYKNYDPTGNKATGSQGFPGYQPADEVNKTRNTIGVYGDLEWDITDKWLVDAAVRLENYSDFGFTHNYKLATRYKLASNFNLRGSISTGFRAPSLQQINFSSTFTTVQGGKISEVKIAPNYSPITAAAGIPELKQEKSVNGSIGFAWTPSKEWTVTVDGYWVKVQDRVVLSGQFDGSNTDLDPFLRQEMTRLGVSLAQFFANAVSTTNKGVDLVIEYNKRMGDNRIKALLAANFQDMTIDKINVPEKLSGTEFLRQTFLSDREQKFILASAPRNKASFNFEYGHKKFSVGTRLTYFGKVTLLGYGEDGLGIDPKVPSDADGNVYVKDEYNYSSKLVTDLYFSYQLNKKLTLFTGADNLFNVHPDLGVAPGAKGWAYNTETGGPWDAVQMGGNGLRLYGKIAFNF